MDSDTKWRCIYALVCLGEWRDRGACGTFFWNPVQWKEEKLDDYPRLVAQPMCIRLLMDNVAEDRYAHMSDFYNHLQLLWKNCTTFWTHTGCDIPVRQRKQWNKIAAKLEFHARSLFKKMKLELPLSTSELKETKEPVPPALSGPLSPTPSASEKSSKRRRKRKESTTRKKKKRGDTGCSSHESLSSPSLDTEEIKRRSEAVECKTTRLDDTEKFQKLKRELPITIERLHVSIKGALLQYLHEKWLHILDLSLLHQDIVRIEFDKLDLRGFIDIDQWITTHHSCPS